MNASPTATRSRRVDCFAAGLLPAILVFGAALCAARPCFAQYRFEAEAYSGAPFGVARVTLSSGPDFRLNRVPRPGGGRIAELTRRIAAQAGKGPTVNWESAEVTLTERVDRAFYPVFEKNDRPILRQFVEVPTSTTILFLFHGDAPLNVTVHAGNPYQGQVVPRQDRAGYERLLRAWWRDYAAAADARGVVREYPAVVEEYLTDTLARRLRLPLPEQAASGGLLLDELNVLFETETARMRMARRVLSGEAFGQPSERLPEELPAPKAELLNPPPADTPIEPLATRVPVESLYVRFGSFSNFLWLRHRIEDWGGELRDVVSERGLDFDLNERFQRQLGLRESALAEVLGERVIADVAIVGTDTFVREGAALGLLFQAKNNTALAADLTQQRLTALKELGGKQEQRTIAGRPVSIITTPDNRLRSIYVSDGDFHLVTTSMNLAELFLETSAGRHESIGASDEFRFTRARLPLAVADTVFVYLSPQFFQNLLSPHYQIELNRRLRSAVEIELLPIAQLAARAEHQPHATIEELVAGDFVPASFAARVDGSELQLEGNTARDSLRGARGSFVPVPDVPIERITPEEATRYANLAQGFTASVGGMAPIVARVARKAMPDGKLERVIVDVEAAPLSQRHVELLSKWLGEPTDARLAPVAGNVVSFEAVLRGGTFFSAGEHHLFGGLRDADPAIALDPQAGIIARLVSSQLQGVQGYLGAWPNPGFLRMLSGILEVPVDPAGYARLRTGLWRRQFNDFTLLSFHPEILEQASAQLKFEKAPRPAQVWVHAEDLSQSRLAGLVNAYGYRQSRQITAGNTRFLNMLSEQLHVPRAEALETAERLLVAKFESPLGGQYELRETSPGVKTWVSSALADAPPNQVPPDYQFPALTWLRGMDLEMGFQNGAIAAHVEATMPVETRPAAGFSLPGLLGGAKPAGNAPPATNNQLPTNKKNAKGSTPAKPPQPKSPAPRPSGAREF
jgi:hypothetical protein